VAESAVARAAGSARGLPLPRSPPRARPATKWLAAPGEQVPRVRARREPARRIREPVPRVRMQERRAQDLRPGRWAQEPRVQDLTQARARERRAQDLRPGRRARERRAQDLGSRGLEQVSEQARPREPAQVSERAASSQSQKVSERAGPQQPARRVGSPAAGAPAAAPPTQEKAPWMFRAEVRFAGVPRSTAAEARQPWAARPGPAWYPAS
jgi:hypothetical protein